MTLAFAREKRLLLAALAVMAPLPLPLNEVVGWPAVAAFCLGAGAFLAATWRGREVGLAPWMMNVLGLAYLPLFWLDLRYLSGLQLVGPVVRLALFALLIKLLALRRERDKWQVLIGIFFVFLAAMATSVHPSVVLYLVAFVVLAMLALARFAYLHVLAGFGRLDPEQARLPLASFLAGAALVAALVAVPLFALLPRVTNPYIFGRGGGTGTVIQSTGFTDEVSLGSIGRIRDNREVAFRVRFDPADRSGELRFKAATFDRYEGRTWRRSPRSSTLDGGYGRTFQLAHGRAQGWAQFFLRPVTGGSLPLPPGALVLEVRERRLDLGTGGALSMTGPARDVVEYRLGFGAAPASLAAAPQQAGGQAALDRGGATPRIADLAVRVMGEGTALDRVRRLESHLATGYRYSLDLQAGGDSPLESFLFETRAGHCEYFASAMVVMLRSQGIPARLAAGFYGAEWNPLTGYHVVRQSNAHAWVEAYLPETGWTIFDPTPAAGRPESGEASGFAVLGQAWDFLIFRWDRYVLTYGFADQVGLFFRFRELWLGLRSFLRRGDPVPAPGAAAPTAAEPTAPAPAVPPEPGLPLEVLVALSLTIAAAGTVALALVRRARAPWSATRAYRALRRTLAHAGLAVPDHLAPMALHRRAAQRFPAAADPAGRVVGLYLRESYGGEELPVEEREAVKEAVRDVARGVRPGRGAGEKEKKAG